ncbi:hypothetical protein [Aureliella helgolandensis]|uniref:Uncharacterized protein n=1 Tax=Aureliella helgolandensis TaxID=2527968 RepID=A0A518G554_9BACT|nr:hypothetical protein [Aureliella helgolandensis]QDV23728.1 hypothetical protein Q31a_20330 [Aureliella helgolandensis]
MQRSDHASNKVTAREHRSPEWRQVLLHLVISDARQVTPRSRAERLDPPAAGRRESEYLPRVESSGVWSELCRIPLGRSSWPSLQAADWVAYQTALVNTALVNTVETIADAK